MSGLFVKVLISSAVVGAVGTGIALAIVEKEKKNKDIAEQAVVADEDDSVIKRIKRYVRKKVIKFLAWVALHMQQIESISAVIGLCSTALGIATAVREFKRGSDQQEQLDRIEVKVDSLITAYNEDVDVDTANRVHDMNWFYKNFCVINDNIKLIGNEIASKENVA